MHHTSLIFVLPLSLSCPAFFLSLASFLMPLSPFSFSLSLSPCVCLSLPPPLSHTHVLFYFSIDSLGILYHALQSCSSPSPSVSCSVPHNGKLKKNKIDKNNNQEKENTSLLHPSCSPTPLYSSQWDSELLCIMQ